MVLRESQAVAFHSLRSDARHLLVYIPARSPRFEVRRRDLCARPSVHRCGCTRICLARPVLCRVVGVYHGTVPPLVPKFGVAADVQRRHRLELTPQRFCDRNLVVLVSLTHA